MAAGTIFASYLGSQYGTAVKLREWKESTLITAANENGAATVALDRHGNVYLWNSGATKLFGYTDREMMGKPISLLMQDDMHEPHAEAFFESMNHGEPTLKQVSCTAIKKLPDGRRQPFTINMTIMSAPPYGAAAIILDDSKIKRASSASVMPASISRSTRLE